jgi:TP901 family phage tail tape measure protein
MAATDDKINVQIEAELTGSFQDQLNKVSELGKKVPLSRKEQGNYDAAMKGAQLSLNSGDMKGFQQNFNKVVDILRAASLSTGKLNSQIDEYTKKIEELSKAVNKRKERLTDIDTKYYGADAKKAGQLKDQEITKIKESYGDVAKNITNKQIRELIAEGFKGLKLEDINLQKKLPENLGMSSRDEAKAYVKIARDVQAQDKEYQKERSQLVNENSADTQAMQSLEEEIKKIQAAAPAAASELEKIYLELSKLKNVTNQQITDQKNAEKVSNARSTDKETLEQGEEILQQNKKQVTSFGKLVRNVTLYHLALRTVRNTMRSAIHTIKELDKQLTEQAMVIGKTRKETYQLLKGYQDLALKLGATTKEVAQVATEYLRQGKTTAEAMKLTEAAISAAKVASINTAESVNYLTTALNGFRLSSADAMKVSDKFAAVAASAAVSYEEIATALSKVASQANLAGMSIDYTTAILAKGIETTREAPETIGTALKTVIARMREIKDYGETLGDGVDLNNVESQLAYVGIELRNNEGELRSTEDVLDDLGRRWDELNSNQQAAIAKALAGTRQQSRLISMMTDYERVIELQEIAEQSQGATVAQMAVYTEGLEAAMNKVAVSWEKVVTTVSNSEIIINLVNSFASVLNIVNEILSNDVVMIGLLTTISLLAVKYVGTKIREKVEQKQIAKVQKIVLAQQAKEAVEAQKAYIQAKKKRLEDERDVRAKEYGSKAAEE